jgi:preprotein translocase subunit SecE
MATQAVKVKNGETPSSAITGAASGVGEKVAGTLQNTRDFVREVRVEMKQVTWPTREDVVSTTWVVIGAVAFFGIFFAIVDWIVQHGVERLFKFFGV